MSILIQKPGILTTVQDLGRFGYRSLGINPGGVMDRQAARLVNLLVGNDEGCAVLEMHFPAAEIVFERACVIAIGGADLSPRLNNLCVENWRAFAAQKGDILRFTEKKLGNRAYCAFSGGIAVDEWLGSRSTNLTAMSGGYCGRKLVNGDRIEIRNSHKSEPVTPQQISASIIPHYSSFPTIRVIAGGEFDLLTSKSKSTFGSHNFTVSNNSNRMGFRLAGEPLTLRDPIEMISSAVSFGTIQLLPDGQLIVLMADHQTSGGYPRLAHIIDDDLSVMAQLGGGDHVGFHLVGLADAELLVAERERDISLLRLACQTRAKN